MASLFGSLRRRAVLALTLAMLGLAASTGSAGAAGIQWLQSGFNAAHTGVNPKEVSLDLTTVPKLAELCHYDAAAGVSTPAVVTNGVVFVASDDGALAAFTEATCDPLWSKMVSGGSPVVGSPIVSGGLVFASTADGNMTAVKASSGKQAWQKSAGDQADEAPVFAGGVLYDTAGIQDDSVFAFDAKTGSSPWSVKESGDLTAPTVGIPVDNAKTMIFAGSSDGSLHAYYVDGSPAWTAPAFTAPIAAAPTLDAKRSAVVAVSDDEGVGAKNYIASFDAATGALKWKRALPAPSTGTPIIVGSQYVVGAGTEIVDVSVKTGKLQWDATMPVTVNATLVAANGVLYGSSDAGFQCDAFALDATNGTEIWDASDTTAFGPTKATPIVIDGGVVVGFASGAAVIFDPPAPIRPLLRRVMR